MMAAAGALKHVSTDPAPLANKRERRRGAAGRAAALRRAPSDSDCSGETASLSADSGERRPPVPKSGKTRNRRRGSEWEVLEGLKEGQRFDRRPEVFNGYLHKKRKWPLKGWHKRFFVVDGGILVYARSPTDVARGRLHGSVDVGLSVISAKARRRRIDIDADEFIYHLRAKTADVFRTWLNVLKVHRLYRQHLLTFGARESMPKINVPLEDLPVPSNEAPSRTESEISLSTSEDTRDVKEMSLNLSKCPLSFGTSTIPMQLSSNWGVKLKKSSDNSILMPLSFGNLDAFDAIFAPQNHSLCSMNCVSKILKANCENIEPVEEEILSSISELLNDLDDENNVSTITNLGSLQDKLKFKEKDARNIRLGPITHKLSSETIEPVGEEIISSISVLLNELDDENNTSTITNLGSLQDKLKFKEKDARNIRLGPLSHKLSSGTTSFKNLPKTPNTHSTYFYQCRLNPPRVNRKPSMKLSPFNQGFKKKQPLPVLEKKSEATTVCFFTPQNKRGNIPCLQDCQMKKSKKCTNLVRYKKKSEPKLQNPMSRGMILGKSRAKPSNPNVFNSPVLINGKYVQLKKENKGIQDKLTISECDKISERLMISILSTLNGTDIESQEDLKKYINEIVTELYDTHIGQDSNVVKLLFKSLLHYWLKNTAQESLRSIVKKQKSVDKPSNLFFTKDEKLSGVLFSKITKETQHGISSKELNDYLKRWDNRNSFVFDRKRRKNRMINDSFEKEKRIQELETLLKNTVYVCETDCGNKSKEKDIEITKKLLSNLSENLDAHNFSDKARNSNSSTEFPKIQETLKNLIGDTSLPADVAKDFLGAYLDVLMAGSDETSESSTYNSKDRKVFLKLSSADSPKCEIATEAVQKTVSKSITTGDKNLNQAKTPDRNILQAEKGQAIDPGQIYLKNLLDKITTIFTKPQPLKTHSSFQSAKTKPIELLDVQFDKRLTSKPIMVNKSVCKPITEFPEKRLIRENRDDKAVLIDLPKYDLEHMSLLNDPADEGKMSRTIDVKEKQTNMREPLLNNLSLRFSPDDAAFGSDFEAMKLQVDSYSSKNLLTTSMEPKVSFRNPCLQLNHHFPDTNKASFNSDASSKALCRVIHESENSVDFTLKNHNFRENLSDSQHVESSDDTYLPCFMITSIKSALHTRNQNNKDQKELLEDRNKVTKDKKKLLKDLKTQQIELLKNFKKDQKEFWKHCKLEQKHLIQKELLEDCKKEKKDPLHSKDLSACTSKVPDTRQDLSVFDPPAPQVIDEKFILLLLENLTLLSKNIPTLHKDINVLYLKLKKRYDKLQRKNQVEGLGLLGQIYSEEIESSHLSDSARLETNSIFTREFVNIATNTQSYYTKPVMKHKGVGEFLISDLVERPIQTEIPIKLKYESKSVLAKSNYWVDKEISSTVNMCVSANVITKSNFEDEELASLYYHYHEPLINIEEPQQKTADITESNSPKGCLKFLRYIPKSDHLVATVDMAVSSPQWNDRTVTKDRGISTVMNYLIDQQPLHTGTNPKKKEEKGKNIIGYQKLYSAPAQTEEQKRKDKMASKKKREFKVYQLFVGKNLTRSSSMTVLNVDFRERSDDIKTIYKCSSDPSFASGFVSPTAPPIRGPQAGFVSGTPGGRFASWIVESGGPLDNLSRDLNQAQQSVQQLQRLLDALEMQHPHHDTDVSLEGASPNVKKDRRKFGLRKKKSTTSKCSSVELAPTLQIDQSSSHSTLSALTAPPSPGGGASSMPNSAASLPIACAATRPQSLPGAEALGPAAGPASLTSLTPDHQLREDFTVLAKDLVHTLKGVVTTLVCERGRLRAAMESAEATTSPGSSMVSALRTNLNTALQQNSELRSRLSRIHDASDLAEMSSANNTDPVTRPFHQSLSFSSSCVSASEFFDAEEHDDDLKTAEMLPGDEAGVIELDGDSSSEAGSLSSQGSEGSASQDSDNSDGALLSTEPRPSSQNGVALSSWSRRTRLPSPRPNQGGPSLWNLLYKNIGKDLSQISMPVTINEPLNMLQRLCEELEYSELLDSAAQCNNPVERMALIAAFAVSAYAASAHRAASKPFNPLLAETYECGRDDKGFRFISEQVSHHPPISACHVDSSAWSLWQEARIKTKFWGKSMEFQPAGRVHVRLHATGDHYSWNKVTTCVHNLFGGQRWVDQYGDMTVTCHGTDINAKLNFVKASSWSSSRHEVRGAVTDGSTGVRLRLQGRWSEALYGGEPPAARCLWRPGAMPPDHEMYYGFTRFAMELNELEPNMKQLLPPTDTRLRPDQRALEEGDIEAAERYKHQLEQAQRERRRDSIEHTPAWFRKSWSDGEEMWVFGNEYWKAREAGFVGHNLPKLW